MTFDEAVSSALKSPKYDVLTGRRPDFFDMLMTRLGELVSGFFESLFRRINLNFNPSGSLAGARLTAYIFIIAAVSVLAIAVILVARRVVRRKRRAPAEFSLAEIFGSLSDAGKLTISGLIAESDRLFAGGEARSAIRFRYIALILALAESGAIKIFETRTNTQIAALLRRAGHPVFKAFVELTDVFNLCWFGEKEINGAGREKYRALTDAALEMLTKGGGNGEPA